MLLSNRKSGKTTLKLYWWFFLFLVRVALSSLLFYLHILQAGEAISAFQKAYYND
ncbi:hypothetical protein M23134_06931 [Microscilla marina ATCC 23134]|uniref:Uncharacterized protein n=1 Tax=Microscilla marina ATCC 23134 TaxID=313606 RepID=A1ZQC1_MICM2|nr:hypothetical protein M23134_06931 [Microscilla marina ATCC 23134]